ncbi:response regulator transcription factor [Deinococcus cellulosilyticus]|uniref:DNA-binding response regulator n=1 Tax=Deinococcus cellulosilyticus (strain DSM 18568 / NBRC 106333 / KACC 11606 / 5516J-15) TaxID=1223518 RepID=A0A511N4D4_DEIC1|nr:response regulator transcription factor [Deinococcus cellulosilyticus]GEM47286.1 DNA-binding response regulator [Deinococcus cellulosilyticus NBRC 106333 = KACC 11606]
MNPIRVLITDDQALMREGLALLLSRNTELQVVGLAGHGKEALELTETLHPDVVLMDVRMPVMDGITATRELLRKHPNLKVILLTTFDDDTAIVEGARAGAHAYLLKDADPAAVAQAVTAVMSGEQRFYVPVASSTERIVAQRLSMPKDVEALSPREKDVLNLMAAGLENKRIAKALNLSESTVKNYVSTILAKLGVTDRTKAVLKAVALGWLAAPR